MNLLSSLHPLGVVRLLHESHSKMVYPELGFPHRVGLYRPVESPSWSPLYWNCRYMKIFLIRELGSILSGYGGTSMLSRGETFAVR